MTESDASAVVETVTSRLWLPSGVTEGTTVAVAQTLSNCVVVTDCVLKASPENRGNTVALVVAARLAVSTTDADPETDGSADGVNDGVAVGESVGTLDTLLDGDERGDADNENDPDADVAALGVTA